MGSCLILIVSYNEVQRLWCFIGGEKQIYYICPNYRPVSILMLYYSIFWTKKTLFISEQKSKEYPEIHTKYASSFW